MKKFNLLFSLFLVCCSLPAQEFLGCTKAEVLDGIAACSNIQAQFTGPRFIKTAIEEQPYYAATYIFDDTDVCYEMCLEFTNLPESKQLAMQCAKEITFLQRSIRTEFREALCFKLIRKIQ